MVGDSRSGGETHNRELEARATVQLRVPKGWQLRLTAGNPERLVVFVHGFGGSASGTWKSFWSHRADDAWWSASDLLFTTYQSIRGHVTGGANLLREHLPSYFPRLPESVLDMDGVRWRDTSTAYTELVVVAHSLGGVVVRKLMLDLLDGWAFDGLVDEKPSLLAAKLRFFSPATAGFLPTGLVGFLYALPDVHSLASLVLSVSPTFKQLQVGSPMLQQIESATVSRVSEGHTELRARIVWAGDERVVDTRRYVSDYPDWTARSTGHLGVCKPHERYVQPWRFVELGHL